MTKVSLYKTKRATTSNPKRQIWQLRWVGTDGKRYGETLGDAAKLTKREAMAIRRERQGKMDNGLSPVNRPGRLGLAEFLQRDRDAVAIDVKPKTIEAMQGVAAHAVRALGENFDIRQIGAAEVGRIKRHVSEDRGLSAATVVKVVRYLQGAFARGVDLKLVTANPFLPQTKTRRSGVKLPKIQKRRINTYKPHEVKAMIAAADAWWATLIRLAYTSGLRCGELLNLTWDDVDLEAATVTVAPKAVGSFEVAGETYPILPWTSKTYSTRTVPIPTETVEALREFKGMKLAASVYVFLSLDRLAVIRDTMAAHGGKLLASFKLVNNLSRQFADIQATASCRGTIHDFRRTYGTVMAKRVPMHDLKRLMGHSNFTTTEAFYLAASDDLSEKVRAAFVA